MTKYVSPFSVFLLSLAFSAACGAREFEDQFGRTINAELVSHTGEDAKTVTINRGGKELEVKISVFSAADQKFIRDWMKSTSPKINYSFRIETTKKKLSETRTKSGFYRRSKVQQYAYEIKITSLCRQPVKDLSVEYRAYMADNYRRTSSSGTVQTSEKIDIKGPLKYNHTATLQTKSFSLDSFRSGYYYSSSSTIKDSLLGVLVRVYDPDGNIIADYRSGSSKFKHTWPAKDGATKVTIE